MIAVDRVTVAERMIVTERSNGIRDVIVIETFLSPRDLGGVHDRRRDERRILIEFANSVERASTTWLKMSHRG